MSIFDAFHEFPDQPLYDPRQMNAYLDYIMLSQALQTRSQARRWLIEETDRLKRLKITKGRGARTDTQTKLQGSGRPRTVHVRESNPQRKLNTNNEIRSSHFGGYTTRDSPKEGSDTYLIWKIAEAFHWDREAVKYAIYNGPYFQHRADFGTKKFRIRMSSAICNTFSRYQPHSQAA